MKLRLLKPHDYNNIRYDAGDIIDTATDEMGKYLIKLGVAEEFKELKEGDIIHHSAGILIYSKEQLSKDDIDNMQEYIDKRFKEEPEKEEITLSKEKAEFTPFPEKKRGRPKKKK